MNGSEYKPITIGNWLITLILLAIPLVNLIMLIIWAASASTQPSKKTFAHAYLILFGIFFCLGLFFALILPIFVHHHAPTGT